MKKQLLNLLLCGAFGTVVQAQTVIYKQDFETEPYSEWSYITGGNLEAGPPACGEAGVDLAGEVSSNSVDFESASNTTSFMVVNPESPCGGYYGTTLFSDQIDVSGVSELYFKGRYYRSSTVGYGFTSLSITFDDGNTVKVFDDDNDFTSRDNWTYFSYSLPVSFITTGTVEISINISAGEAIGLDDLEISDFPDIITSTSETDEAAFIIYPTIVENQVNVEVNGGYTISQISLVDMDGTILMENEQTTVLDLSWVSSGVYLINVMATTGEYFTYRIIKK